MVSDKSALQSASMEIVKNVLALPFPVFFIGHLFHKLVMKQMEVKCHSVFLPCSRLQITPLLLGVM